jgi:hypothetical protein
MSVQLVMWAFVWGMTVFDTGFAWAYRQTFNQWEMNPIAAALAAHWGLAAALSFRLVTVAGGCLVICLARRHVRWTATTLVFAVHFALLVVYSRILIA